MAFVPDIAIEYSGEISHAAFHLYAALCRYRNRDSSQAWPSLRTLQRVTGIHYSYIPKLLENLKTKGWIDITEGGRATLKMGFGSPDECSTESNTGPDCSTHQNTECSTDQNSPVLLSRTPAQKCSTDSHDCSSGSSPYKEYEPGENQEKRESSRKQRRPDPFFEALASLCQTNLHTMTNNARGELNQAAGILKKAGATVEDLERWGNWWRERDWRGKKGERPTVTLIRNHWDDGKNYRRKTSTDAASSEVSRGELARLIKKDPTYSDFPPAALEPIIEKEWQRINHSERTNGPGGN